MFQMENTKIGIAFHDDGTTSFFAELEKSSAKQREHIEEAREEKRAEKKAAEKKAEKELQNYAKSSTDTKRTSVWADSLEELIEKIKAVDWENVKAEKRLKMEADLTIVSKYALGIDVSARNIFCRIHNR